MYYVFLVNPNTKPLSNLGFVGAGVIFGDDELNHVILNIDKAKKVNINKLKRGNQILAGNATEFEAMSLEKILTWIDIHSLPAEFGFRRAIPKLRWLSKITGGPTIFVSSEEMKRQVLKEVENGHMHNEGFVVIGPVPEEYL